METDVYVDLLFLINFSMDYICLYITVKILHQKIKLSRMLISSLLGGAYSVAALFLPISGGVELLVDCIVGLAMCIIAFSEQGRRFSRVLTYGFLFVGISMMMGGCMTAIFNLLSSLDLPLEEIPEDSLSTYTFALLAAAAGVISLTSGRLISRRTAAKKCSVELTLCREKFELSGLCDSGNLVRDPISHKPVIFVDRATLEARIDLSFADDFARGHLSASSPVKSMRLIIINTAGGSSTLVAMAPEELKITVESKNSKPQAITPDALIAPTSINKNSDEINAIVPAELIKNA